MTVDRKTFAVYAITKHGIAIASRLMPQLSDAYLFVSEKLIASAPPGARRLPLPKGPT